jgi:hypothetical protein
LKKKEPPRHQGFFNGKNTRNICVYLRLSAVEKKGTTLGIISAIGNSGKISLLLEA